MAQIFGIDPETAMTLKRFTTSDGSFAFKQLAALALVALANWLFYGEQPGWTLGLFALAWGAMVAMTGKTSTARRAALLAALAFALVMIDDPNPLAACLFLLAIGSAALLTRSRFDDALSWAGRLATLGLLGSVAPLRDLRPILRSRSPRGIDPRGLTTLLALPLIGGAVFVALFANANPVIGSVIAQIEVPGLATLVLHLLLWAVVILLVWPSLRPRSLPFRVIEAGDTAPAGPGLPVATLTLSLVTFNAIFLVENILDIVFLWSGAPLPSDVTMASYAHRGAYSLIVTALLAGLFVLVALRPGGSAARSPLVRQLVVLWVAQNLLLVASSILRTFDYIDAYSLTVLRISALAWMALVATGLVLICWRMLAGRSARWLINTNAAAALVVLTLASVIDLGAVAATWNVAHARRAEGLDLCYLNRLGSSALLPLIELERRAAGPRLRDQARYLRDATLAETERRQQDWHSWTWRDARRLARAQALLGPTPTRPNTGEARQCDGRPFPHRLTQEAKR